MPQESEDFLDVITRAQRVTAGDVANPFESGKNAFVHGRNTGVPDLDWDAHVEVFALPADAGDYEDIMNMCLRGEATMRYEERTWSKEGDFMVAVVYLTPRPRAAPVDDYAAGEAEPAVRPLKQA